MQILNLIYLNAYLQIYTCKYINAYLHNAIHADFLKVKLIRILIILKGK